MPVDGNLDSRAMEHRGSLRERLRTDSKLSPGPSRDVELSDDRRINTDRIEGDFDELSLPAASSSRRRDYHLQARRQQFPSFTPTHEDSPDQDLFHQSSNEPEYQDPGYGWSQYPFQEPPDARKREWELAEAKLSGQVRPDTPPDYIERLAPIFDLPEPEETFGHYTRYFQSRDSYAHQRTGNGQPRTEKSVRSNYSENQPTSSLPHQRVRTRPNPPERTVQGDPFLNQDPAPRATKILDDYGSWGETSSAANYHTQFTLRPGASYKKPPQLESAAEASRLKNQRRVPQGEAETDDDFGGYPCAGSPKKSSHHRRRRPKPHCAGIKQFEPSFYPANHPDQYPPHPQESFAHSNPRHRHKESSLPAWETPEPREVAQAVFGLNPSGPPVTSQQRGGFQQLSKHIVEHNQEASTAAYAEFAVDPQKRRDFEVDSGFSSRRGNRNPQRPSKDSGKSNSKGENKTSNENRGHRSDPKDTSERVKGVERALPEHSNGGFKSNKEGDSVSRPLRGERRHRSDPKDASRASVARRHGKSKSQPTQDEANLVAPPAPENLFKSRRLRKIFGVFSSGGGSKNRTETEKASPEKKTELPRPLTKTVNEIEGPRTTKGHQAAQQSVSESLIGDFSYLSHFWSSATTSPGTASQQPLIETSQFAPQYLASKRALQGNSSKRAGSRSDDLLDRNNPIVIQSLTLSPPVKKDKGEQAHHSPDTYKDPSPERPNKQLAKHLPRNLRTPGGTPAIKISKPLHLHLPSGSAFASGSVDTNFPLSSNNVSGLSISQAKFLRMENRLLQVRGEASSSIKQKALDDARQMQATVLESCKKTGEAPPKYALQELIGKGSFGRVYKGKDMVSADFVAVKIIDIDESDTINPRNADAYSDFLKEVSALKLLGESKARNINILIDALPVGKSMWMITEYCGGGSIATLMKPTAPGGLQEKWIIPIVREVAEGLRWVHQAGIIHRDIKCANVLITEAGGLQLCDFGVAGVVESKIDKRSTVIGTPHWMAPELWNGAPSYGKEIDIWAFGCTIYEAATGLPPYVDTQYADLFSANKPAPRLEGGNYSNELRAIIAFCLEIEPKARPTIEELQKHPYIYNSQTRYPTSSLSGLVRAFKMWEEHGGSRRSLFMPGGAQGPSEVTPSKLPSSTYDNEWNFSTTAAFDQDFINNANPQDVYEAYGPSAMGFSEETTRPNQYQKPSRRRPPPEALSRLPTAPLQKVFDPNTMSNYADNSMNVYGPPPKDLSPPKENTSDLPLRDDSAQASIRDTMIDLGGHDSETGISVFPDLDTIRPDRRPLRDESEEQYGGVNDYRRPPLSDPADINQNRRTQDWTFPTDMTVPASADPETSRFPMTYEPQLPAVTPASGGRPALVHHPTEPVGGFGGMLGASSNAMDRVSLIDLDMSLPDFQPEGTRPSTANSDVDSTASAASEYKPGNPFELERHASMYHTGTMDLREPSSYAADPLVGRAVPRTRAQEIAEMSDFSHSDAELSTQSGNGDERRYDNGSDSEYLPTRAQGYQSQSVAGGAPVADSLAHPMSRFPELPPPPSASTLAGTASREEMRDEVVRQLAGMNGQLMAFREIYDAPPRRRGGGSNGNL